MSRVLGLLSPAKIWQEDQWRTFGEEKGAKMAGRLVLSLSSSFRAFCMPNKAKQKADRCTLFGRR
jgi:hypothetical protein